MITSNLSLHFQGIISLNILYVPLLQQIIYYIEITYYIVVSIGKCGHVLDRDSFYSITMMLSDNQSMLLNDNK